MKRGTLFPETARILEHHRYPAQQYLLRLRAPLSATHAMPGQFVHLQCDPCLMHRRPMSIMRVDRKQGDVDVLYKVHGEGTQRLSEKQPGASLALLGPIGRPFKQSGYLRHPILIGGGLGIPPMIFLALHMQRAAPESKPLVVFGSETPFPFSPRPSTIMVAGLPADVVAAMPLLEDWGIASRLCSLRGSPACYQGQVTDLARHYLQSGGASLQGHTEIFACGPPGMNRAVARLASEYGLPCQMSLEERMACATGGCAGCVVPVHSKGQMQMQRVCVEGPVFQAEQVYPEEYRQCSATACHDAPQDTV